MLLADGLVGHGGRAAAPLLAVGALAAELLRQGLHDAHAPSSAAGRLRQHGHARIRGGEEAEGLGFGGGGDREGVGKGWAAGRNGDGGGGGV